MDHDEIVESSDREEVESIQAGDVEYWSRAIALAAVTHVQPVSSVMGYGAHDGPAEGPPFKRMKASTMCESSMIFFNPPYSCLLHLIPYSGARLRRHFL